MKRILFLFLLAASLPLCAQTAKDSVADSADTLQLSALRAKIDSLDNQLIKILAERMKVCQAVGEYKKRHHVAVVQRNRFEEIMERLCKQGQEEGLTESFVKEIMNDIHKESVRQQNELLDKIKEDVDNKIEELKRQNNQQ
jgi:chorismate mutase